MWVHISSMIHPCQNGSCSIYRSKVTPSDYLVYCQMVAQSGGWNCLANIQVYGKTKACLISLQITYNYHKQWF